MSTSATELQDLATLRHQKGISLQQIATATKIGVHYLEAIEHGHKIALVHISKGENIIKFGVVIGTATCAINKGEWVHLHNCGSRLDERSNAFDVHTGVPEDVRYE